MRSQTPEGQQPDEVSSNQASKRKRPGKPKLTGPKVRSTTQAGAGGWTSPLDGSRNAASADIAGCGLEITQRFQMGGLARTRA